MLKYTLEFYAITGAIILIEQPFMQSAFTRFKKGDLPMLQKYLECGQIIKAHGINGAMIVTHFCDSLEVFLALKRVYFKNGEEYNSVKILRAVPYKNSVLVTLEGITTPEQVVSIRMQKLYADRKDIAKGKNDFFIVDLIGLPVKDFETGEVYGTLKDVLTSGVQDIYVIERENKKDAYVPAIPQFVAKISLTEGILITPIEGLID